MTKIQFIIALRKISFNLEDISEDENHNFVLGLELAKKITDKVWKVANKLEG